MQMRALKLQNDANGGRIQPGEVIDVDEGRGRQLLEGGYAISLERQDYVGWDQGFGRQLSPLAGATHYGAREAGMLPTARSPRVIQLTQYDPGSAGYRYHSAFNHAADVDGTRATSAFVRYGQSNPYCDLRQYDGDRHRAGVSALFETADVVHVHMDYTTLDDCAKRWPDRQRQLLVRHYHGSQSPESFATDYRLVQQALDDQVGAVLIGARMYHQKRYGAHIPWVPIPVPVQDYRALRNQLWVPVEERPSKRIRICHSPTNERVKGTIQMDCVIFELINKGWPIEYFKIMGRKHGDCLKLKATCDITFDSFWLGIQGSGLEGGAMGQAVIAGDSEVRNEYLEEFGECPYTFAKDHEAIVAVLERLVFDAEYRAVEAARVSAYVEQVHDYAPVGRKYWEIVNAALKERNLVAA